MNAGARRTGGNTEQVIPGGRAGREIGRGGQSASGEPRFRLAFVISHPTQHHAPLFRLLATLSRLHVRVFYCCDWGVKSYRDPGFGTEFAWDVDLLSGYESVFLPIRRRPANLDFWEVDNPAISARLDEFAPHAIWLHGYGHRTIWRAAGWAKDRAALLHFGDSELLHERGFLRRAVKEFVVRWHFRRCDAFITIGDNNESYYAHYGVPQAKMFRGAYPVDIGRFRESARTSTMTRSDLRSRYGLAQDGSLLVQVGKLEPRKRPFDFVDAIARLADSQPPIVGLLVGDGALRQDLETRIARQALGGRVAITGFVNQTEIPGVLGAADALVCASDFDPHPLVVTEAMALGLPIVASDMIGCVGPSDAARPDVNTLVYRCGDTSMLASRINELVQDSALRKRLGAASYSLAASQDLAVAGEAVLRALRSLGEGRWKSWANMGLGPRLQDSFVAGA